MAKANDLSGFSFQFTGYGHYRVTYQTPQRGDYWVATIDDMTIIDATKNADWAKRRDIEHLLYLVKSKGTHYSKTGKRLEQ